MDLREQDKRFAARHTAIGCATTMKFLVILLVLIAIIVAAIQLQDGVTLETLAAALVSFVMICSLAAIMWALGLIMIWQTRIEENTRAATDALEKLAGTGRDTSLSDLTARDITPPTEDTDG